MPLIRYIQHDGTEYEVDVAVGSTVMEGAVDNMIDGILAECGGSCSCATCHVYVDQKYLEKTGKAEGIEQDMLDVVSDPAENSRLSCQITVTDEMEGMVVRLPESQY